MPWFPCSLVSNGDHVLIKGNKKRTVFLGIHGRGKVHCVFEFDNPFPVINSEIILFWSFLEASVDWAFIYALQSQNSQMLDFQFVPNIPPGKKLHFMSVYRTKTSIRMLVNLKVAAASSSLKEYIQPITELHFLFSHWLFTVKWNSL